MKVWTKIKLTDRDKNIEILSRAVTNYLYKYGPIESILTKYQINTKEKEQLEEYMANRIAGLLMLYLADDKRRIKDIVNKYYTNDSNNQKIIPELEGYIERTRTKDRRN